MLVDWLRVKKPHLKGKKTWNHTMTLGHFVILEKEWKMFLGNRGVWVSPSSYFSGYLIVIDSWWVLLIAFLVASIEIIKKGILRRPRKYLTFENLTTSACKYILATPWKFLWFQAKYEYFKMSYHNNSSWKTTIVFDCTVITI